MANEDWSAAAIWQIVSERLQKSDPKLYRQWFNKMVPLRCEDGVLYLGVHDGFFADVICEHYNEVLLDALKDIHGVNLAYGVEPGHKMPETAAKTPAGKQPPAVIEYRRGGEASSGTNRPRLCKDSSDFTFDNFVVGDENRGAFAAARAVAENPGSVYNPLFIYGASGVGKTHLLNAIASEIAQRQPGLRIRSTTCDSLLNEFYELLFAKKSLAEFRSGLRDVDVLLVDDVHHLAKKVQMQEEFFNAFNLLYQNNKQIVLTSDREPCEMSDIDKRLSTRFESNLVSEINMPEYEARLAILKMWSRNVVTPHPLPDEFLDFLALNISSSVRRLRGAFFRLVSYASLNGVDQLTIEKAETLLRGVIGQERRDISPELIQKEVAKYFNLTIADLIGGRKTKNIAEPRMVAMFLCRELTELSSTEIGAAFGRNHSTVLYAEKQVTKLCEEAEYIRRAVAQLRHEIKKP